MVATRRLGRIFSTQRYIFCSTDSHWMIERVMIFQGWPIPGKRTIGNHYGWVNLLHLFRP